MRTFADKQRETAERRYGDDATDTRKYDPEIAAEAKMILSSQGGKKAARFAIKDMWDQADRPGQGYLPTARLRAPLHVLRAMETLGIVERATDDRGVAIRFRLTEAGRRMARAAEQRGAA